MNVFVFGGTTEGRKISTALSNAGMDVTLSVATEFAQNLVTEHNLIEHNLAIIADRLGAEEMIRVLKEGAFEYVIDATHPYAILATQNIRSACQAVGLKYFRLIRPESTVDAAIPGLTYVEDTGTAVQLLNKKLHNKDFHNKEQLPNKEQCLNKEQHHNKIGHQSCEKILLTIGSKELKSFTQVENFAERLFVRILPMPESLKKALDLGFRGSNIICMQGPFDKDMNIATLKMTGAEYLVTKDSGDAGGFEAKISAARSLGCKVIVIARPVREEGYTLDELLDELLGF